MESNEHLFYVLECRDGTYYAGYTNDIHRRVALHNSGKGAKYTRGRGPVKLLYHKGYPNKGDALRAEYEFKQYTRKQKENFLAKELGGLDVATEKL